MTTLTSKDRPRLANLIQIIKVALSRQPFIYRVATYQPSFIERRKLLFIMDACLLLLALLSSLQVWFWHSHDVFTAERIDAYGYRYLGFLAGYGFLAWIHNLYHLPSSTNFVAGLIRLLSVAIWLFGLSLSVFYFSSTAGPFSLAFTGCFLTLAVLYLAVGRWIYAGWFTSAARRYRAVLVGPGSQSQAIALQCQQRSNQHYQILGFVGDLNQTSDSAQPMPLSPHLGEIAQLTSLISQLRVQEVVVASPHPVDQPFFEALLRCREQGLRIAALPDIIARFEQRIPIDLIDRAWVLEMMSHLPHRLHLLTKRLIDIVLATTMLIGLFPLWPLIGLLIRLDSNGPIFYGQTRSGHNNHPFTIFKFRTMVVDAEADGQARWSSQNDERITRVGKFLRKTHLDELPQLVNVLKNEMSLVGPRPERPEFVTQLEAEIPFYRTRMLLKPGLTGWAQIHHTYSNNATDALTKLQYDLYYLRYGSIWLDIYTLFHTLAVVAKCKGV